MITLVSAVAIASLCVFQTQRALENESVRLWKTLVNQILSVYHLCWKGDPPLPQSGFEDCGCACDALQCTGGLDRAVGQAKHLVTKPMKILLKPFQELEMILLV